MEVKRTMSEEPMAATSVMGITNHPPLHGKSLMQCSGVRQATCDTCGTAFRGEYARGNLQRHRRHMHSGTTYYCEAVSCRKKFSRADNRLKHYRKDHPEMNVPPAAVRKN